MFPNTSRRGLLAATGGILAAPMLANRARAAETLVVADPGGDYSRAFTRAFHEPFQAATGHRPVAVVRRSHPTSQIRAMIETRNYDWDVVYVTHEVAYELQRNNMLEEIDNSRATLTSLPESLRSPYLGPIAIDALNFAYSTQRFRDRPPASWEDIGNLSAFPGRRSLGKRPYDTFEMVMLSLGVPPADLYKELAKPDGFDRVFRKLTELRPHISYWWESGAQNAQALVTREADLVGGYAARHQVAIQQGAPYAVNWNEGLYYVSGFVIPKGSPKRDLARQFIASTWDPQRQAACMQILPSGTGNPEAMKHLPPERARLLATWPENFAKLTTVDGQFWYEHKAPAQERLNAWFLSR